ncbi:DTX14 [Scenedesmus sp. PABB004]|nr:DTX14 [Scenedesmus sp. PABB004]
MAGECAGAERGLAGRAEQPLAKRVGKELIRLSHMAGPLFLQNIFSYSTSVVAVAFIGHLGDKSLLASAVLANSLFNVTGYSVVSGLSAGMETLCGQAYGARSYKTLGLVLQRAVVITWLACLPITLLWAHSERVMLALGQDPHIAAGAATYLWAITPTLFMAALTECLKRYLLAQRVVLPGMVVTIVTALAAPLYFWLLTARWQLGLLGAARAFVLSQGTGAALLLGYTLWRDAARAGTPDATWPRPGAAVLAGWGTYLSYGLPAAAMICMEWWCYEVVIFMAGAAHNAELAVSVMGILFQLSACSYMSAMAYGSSVNTRVSNELGAGRAAPARLAFQIGVCAVVAVQSLWVVAGLAFGRALVGLLSSNAEVVAHTLEVLPLVIPTFVTDAVNCVCMGVLRGAGRPGVGAVLNIIAYWMLGVPLAWLFGLRMRMSTRGFWLGLLVTSAGQSLVQLAVLARLDWREEVARAAALMAGRDDEDADAKAAALGGLGAAAAKRGAGGTASGGDDDTAPLRDGAAAGERASLLGGLRSGSSSGGELAGEQQEQPQQGPWRPGGCGRRPGSPPGGARAGSELQLAPSLHRELLASLRPCLDKRLREHMDRRALAALTLTVKGAAFTQQEALGRVEAMCRQYRPEQKPVDTLAEIGLLDAVPFLARRLCAARQAEQAPGVAPGGAYLAYVGLLNQAVMMSTQLYNDAANPAHHKYAAHQVALLYQSLNMLQGETKPIRRLIEGRFDDIKAITEGPTPYLDPELGSWLQGVTWLCREEITVCPGYVHRRLSPLLSALKAH